jgi:alkylated DNA repair dioxygenase AlkB
MPNKAKPLKSRGPHVLEPRITAFYALDGHSYSYDNLVQQSVDDLSIPAIDLIERAFEQTGIVFDVAMINRYRNSRDKIGHHRDEDAMDEPVGSFSLGRSRQFLITAQTRPAKNSKILCMIHLLFSVIDLVFVFVGKGISFFTMVPLW